MKLLDSKNTIGEERPKPPPPAHAVASSEDLLREIFSRLRPKQLARFKLVSRRWNSIISDPDLLLNRPPKPADGLVFTSFGVIPFLVEPFDKSDIGSEPPSFPGNKPFSSIKFVHGCNGLMLCSGKDKNEHGAVKHFVINPTTVKYKTLPERDGSMEMLGMCLAFDPSKSRHYKVVCVSGIRHPKTSRSSLYKQFEVYSSETGSWRVRSLENSSFKGNLDIENGAYWNGGLHWIPKNRKYFDSMFWNTGTEVFAKEGGLDSIHFNPDHDTHNVFQTPRNPNWFDTAEYVRHLTYFGESCGHLHYVVYHTEYYNLVVYEMRRDYSEWFVKYTSRVDVRSCGYIRRMDDSDRIHALVRGKKDDDCFLIFRVKGRTTVRYNIGCRRDETTHDNWLDPYNKGLPLPYFESMCLV